MLHAKRGFIIISKGQSLSLSLSLSLLVFCLRLSLAGDRSGRPARPSTPPPIAALVHSVAGRRGPVQVRKREEVRILRREERDAERENGARWERTVTER